VNETRWPILGASKPAAGTVWTVRTPTVAFYRILPGKSADEGRQVLGAYRGIAVVDGFAVYEVLARDGPGLTLAHCWAHVQRKYAEIADQWPVACGAIGTLIGELYAIERLVPGPFPGDAAAQALRQQLRRDRAQPVLDQIWHWATVQAGLPRSDFGKAVRYMLERWDGLTRFVHDSRIPLDNNAAERTLRGPVVGRKNHYGSRSLHGTQVAASSTPSARRPTWSGSIRTPISCTRWMPPSPRRARSRCPTRSCLPHNIVASRRCDSSGHGQGEDIRKIARFYQQHFGLTVTPGGLVHALHRAARQAAPTYGALRDVVRQSPVVAPDETGWRVGAELHWLWGAATPTTTVYAIQPGRGFDQAAALLGADFAGVLVRDGWAPYRQFEHAAHQTCVAHLLRRARELQIDHPRAPLPAQVQAVLQQALRVRDRHAAGALSAHGVAVARGHLQARLATVLEQSSTVPAVRRFAAHLDREWSALFSFLYDPAIEATNWRAEQALRPAVANRKVCGSNRTSFAAQTQQILATVFRTEPTTRLRPARDPWRPPARARPAHRRVTLPALIGPPSGHLVSATPLDPRGMGVISFTSLRSEPAKRIP
jgi:transposase